jgi:monoglucosyldiacylglycerol epimerase
MSNLYLCLPIALASVLWAEIVRDLYHSLAHAWAPLYRLHVYHHKVFRKDLTAVSPEIYRQAHWYNDVPEALVMLGLSLVPWWVVSAWNLPLQGMGWAGALYTLLFLVTAIARGAGLPGAEALTDITHRPGAFEAAPTPWTVNRTYHWRHHFDDQNAYFCGTFTLVDKLMGTALSLKGKTVAVTGANGTLGRALLLQLHRTGAKPVALTTGDTPVELQAGREQKIPIKTLQWRVGEEADLAQQLQGIDILVINHGINPPDPDKRATPEQVRQAYEVNFFSGLRLMEVFFTTVKTNPQIACKEVWVNTSEAEVNPTFSPLYELSKRSFGEMVTLQRLSAPCVVRKVILGPFKSDLNPIGIMSADWVAKMIVNLAKRDVRNMVITINPLTFVLYPLKEAIATQYFKLCGYGKAKGRKSARKATIA